MAELTIPEPLNKAEPTELDEDAVLAELYGAADADGIYRRQEG